MLSIPANVSVLSVYDGDRHAEKLRWAAHVGAASVQRDPLDGHLFLFVNRRGDRVKILWWDRDGLAIFYKRLEAGTYQLPAATDDCARSGDRRHGLGDAAQRQSTSNRPSVANGIHASLERDGSTTTSRQGDQLLRTALIAFFLRSRRRCVVSGKLFLTFS